MCSMLITSDKSEPESLKSINNGNEPKKPYPKKIKQMVRI